MLNNLYKQLKLFYLAKKEHKQRLQQPLHNLDFNRTVEAIKEINKQILLHKLMEVTNTSEYDLMGIASLDHLIEINKERGLVSEFYTNPMEVKYD